MKGARESIRRLSPVTKKVKTKNNMTNTYEWATDTERMEKAWKAMFDRNQTLIAEGKEPVEITEELLKVEYDALEKQTD